MMMRRSRVLRPALRRGMLKDWVGRAYDDEGGWLMKSNGMTFESRGFVKPLTLSNGEHPRPRMTSRVWQRLILSVFVLGLASPSAVAARPLEWSFPSNLISSWQEKQESPRDA